MSQLSIPYKMFWIVGFYYVLLISKLQLSKSVDATMLTRQPREHIEGVTFEALHVFQSYPVDRRNTDQTWKLFGTCDGLSGHRETNHKDSPFQDEPPNVVSKPCYSVLRNCRVDESMERHVSFCVSRDQHRKYDYMVINTDENHVYGRNLQRGVCPSSKFEIYFSYGVYYPCICDCESSERQVDRYFSLLDVVSDKDKVVTGVRFRKIDNVFYIQIQQVRFDMNKIIRGQAKWKDVKKVDKSDLLSNNVSEYYKQEGHDEKLLKFHENNLVYAVTSEQNTIFLDDHVGGPNEILTGLRFRQVGKDLRFEIQVTPFNNATAILDRNSSRWIYNDIDKSNRAEVKLHNPSIHGRRELMNIPSFGSKFIKFHVSDFKKDLGQTTVPFIEVRPVYLASPQQIYGAGIYHKRSPNSAGFIAFALHFEEFLQ